MTIKRKLTIYCDHDDCIVNQTVLEESDSGDKYALQRILELGWSFQGDKSFCPRHKVLF